MTAETAAEKTPSKPVRKPPTPEEVGRQIVWLERVLAALVLVLAFFLGSFAARNTDLWMHLATGRLLAQGGYTFGADPFSYTSTSPWINHAWLFDLLLYGLSAAAGGAEAPAAGVVLVGFKALLVVALAWVLLQIRRPGFPLWAPIFCTLLTLLALSHNLELRPRVMSLLFLAVTLCVLVGSRTLASGSPLNKVGRTPGPFPSVQLWLLVPLCALWANLDSWFLLGPFTVGLFLLGEGFQQAFDPGRFGDDKPRQGDLKRLFQVFLACVVASLLNPHHLYGFALPAEWAGGTRAALQQGDAQFLRSYSLWESSYFRTGAPGRSVAGLAYYLLLAAGVVSFLLNQRGWRWSRAFLWIVFALLSVGQASLTGLSAVVLGPLAALNLQDYARQRFGVTPPVDATGRAWALGGRALTLLLAAVLLLAAWPGWLHALPTDPRHDRRVAWRVEVEPSLREAALQIAAWRDDGKWTADRLGFLFHPDVAHYFAWFAPQERGFLDHRHALFGGVAAEYMKVRQALRGPVNLPPGSDVRAQEQALQAAYEAVLRKWQVGHVVLYFNETDGAVRETDAVRSPTANLVMEWLLGHPSRWTPVYLKGRVVVFRWNDPPQVVPAELARSGHVDLNPLAFGPDLPATERAPAAAPERPAARRSLWERYLRPEMPASPDLHQAHRYRDYYEQVGRLWPFSYQVAQYPVLVTSAVGRAPAAPGAVLAPTTAYSLFSPHIRAYENAGPPAAALLAVRAARRAVAANPESPGAYLSLARSYETLWQQQEARWDNRWSNSLLRQVQVLGALRQVVALRPEEENAHARLADWYMRLGHHDLALDHRRTHLQLARKAGPSPRTPREQFQKAVETEEKAIQQLEANLQKVRNEYLVAAEKRPPAVRAQLARQAGLTKEAIQLLIQQGTSQKATPERPQEIAFLVELLFSTGQLHEAKELLQPELRVFLGPPYDMHMTMLSAALGNYKEAANYLDELLAQVSKPRREAFGPALGMLTYAAWLRDQPLGRLTLHALNAEANQPSKMGFVLQGHLRFEAALAQEVELNFLRGLLALEEGDTEAAERHLGLAVSLAGPRPFDGLPASRRYLKLLRAARP